MTSVVAGAYVISAKTLVVAPGTGDNWTVTCTLDAGGGFTDTAGYEFTSNVGSVDLDHRTTLSMQLSRVFASTGSIVLRCQSTDAANASMTKIHAIKVDTVTHEAVTG
jgi:hypothetical protein